MSTDVRVPTTGNAGEDAVIVDWNVKVGSQVSAGDILVVLETAKATIEVEAPISGEVLKLLYAAGDEAPEHEVLAILGEPGEKLDGVSSAGPAASRTDPGATAPAEASTDVTIAFKSATDQAARPVRTERIPISPRARILANRNGLDITSLAGTGPGGRIIMVDVLAARQTAGPSAAVPSTSAPEGRLSQESPSVQASLHQSESTVVPVRGARKVTAQRMQASLQSTAQVTLTRYAKADALLGYIARLREVTVARSLPKIGVNEAVMFATARAVAKHPEANSWFDWDGIRQFRVVNLGFAVDTGKALLVPVIPGADSLSLAGLSQTAKTAIEKARAGKLTVSEMEGGTFTVSNLGSLGVHWFTPVLNPPQSCILGVGATHQLHDDGPRLLPLSLTFDHRALDGAAAAQVLAEIVSAIETVDVLAAF